MTGIFNLITNAGQNTAMVEFSFVWIEVIAYAVCAALLVFFFVEKGLKQDRETIKAAQKAAVEAAGGVWEDPEEKLKREEAEVEAEEARKAELKAKCEKKGLDFDAEEAKYQAKLAVKQSNKKN